MLRELAPGFAGAEVEHDEAGAVFVAGVDDVGNSLAGGSGVRAHVEAEVVHVGVWEVNGRGKGVGARDGIGGQVHADEFRAAGSCIGHGEHGGLVDTWTAGVKDPEGIVRCNV